MDVLTRKQLEDQLKRQQAQLEEMKAAGKEPSVIDAFEKFVLLTQRRLERLENADYEEDLQSVQRMGGNHG